MTAAGIAPIRPLDEEAALAWLRSQPGGRTTLRAAELGRRWGWHRQRTGRRLEGLADERKREAGTLAALQAERASGAAKARQLDAESAPIRYVAELVGTNTDSERTIRC